MSDFQYKKDYNFFLEKLAKGNKDLFSKKYLKLFDFRDPSIKRKEFNKIRNNLYKRLVLKFGEKCQLKIHPDCSKEKVFDVVHFIPLSTNKLNKEIRNVKAEKGKKLQVKALAQMIFLI